MKRKGLVLHLLPVASQHEIALLFLVAYASEAPHLAASRRAGEWTACESTDWGEDLREQGPWSRRMGTPAMGS